MPDAWLPGFERTPSAHSNGGTYLANIPWRFVGHTTEVVPSSLNGAHAMARRHANPPHLWVWPERNWRAQTVRLDRSAFALAHPAGTPHTNKMRAIQVEVIGHAADMHAKDNAFWDWLGRNVLRPVIDAGYPINLDAIASTTGPNGYGVNGAVRMTRSRWTTFDGVCVHANVPDNRHWDMGKANLRRMALAAKPPAKPTSAPATQQGDDMPSSVYIFRRDPRNNRVYRIPIPGDSKTWVDANDIAVDNLNQQSLGCESQSIVMVPNTTAGLHWLDSYKTVT
jgi:hypothetical protein